MQRCIVQEVAGLTGKACHQYHSLMRSNGQAPNRIDNPMVMQILATRRSQTMDTLNGQLAREEAIKNYSHAILNAKSSHALDVSADTALQHQASYLGSIKYRIQQRGLKMTENKNPIINEKKKKSKAAKPKPAAKKRKRNLEIEIA